LVIWGSQRAVSLPGARWLDAVGNAVDEPWLDPARPLIALPAENGAALDLTLLSLGTTPVRADSFFEFSLEGGAWSQATPVDDIARPLQALGGGKPGAPWRPYLGIDWLRPLQVSEWTVVPANFSPGSREKTHPVTETVHLPATSNASPVLRLCGFVNVPVESSDGVTLSIETDGTALLDRPLQPGESFVLDLRLPSVERLSFTIDPGDTASGDRVRRRYVVVENANCPAVRAQL
ncbi:MAG: hypothetical protein AAF565_13075, partial [Pseudomonadota bacterium]